MLFAFKIFLLPVPTRPGTRTFLQVPDPSRPEVKNPYPSDPAHQHPTFQSTSVLNKYSSDCKGQTEKNSVIVKQTADEGKAIQYSHAIHVQR